MYVTPINEDRGQEFERAHGGIWKDLKEEKEGGNDVLILQLLQSQDIK